MLTATFWNAVGRRKKRSLPLPARWAPAAMCGSKHGEEMVGGWGTQFLPWEEKREKKIKHHGALLQTSFSQLYSRLQEHPKSCLFPDDASKEEQTMPSCHDIFNDESFS